MNLQHGKYDKDYLANANARGPVVNDATAYGVRIVDSGAAEGQFYWQVIGVHHLIPEENGSDHHVYLEVLDDNGKRIRVDQARVEWTWQDKRPDEVAKPVVLDKRDNEPAGNFQIDHVSQIVSVWVSNIGPGPREPSDRVENITTRHPDERASTGELWNTVGHHSFYVVFQRRLRAPTAPHDGVIQGKIANGRGYKVRLLQGDNAVAEQQADATGSFSFTGLKHDTYRLEATAPAVIRDHIQVDEQHVQVNVNLAAP